MGESSTYIPRRSVLYMPGSNARALEKARALTVDGLILDLEDAVAPADKARAREAVCEAARSGAYGRREVTIRVNGIGTQWHEDDLRAAAQAGPAGVVVPKVGSADEVRSLVAALESAGAPERTRLWAMVETPRAVLDVAEIASASARLEVLVLGTNDLVKELRAQHVPGRAPIVPALARVVLAARAAGVAVLDGVFNDTKDAEGFAAECVQARDLGFDGKTLIHPGQVDVCNATFSPSAAAVAEAREVIEAWESGAGRGVVTVGGRMVESLHVEMAREVLAVHDAVTALAAPSS